MKLVIFGLTVSSSWGNGHATIWRGLCGAMARRGHRVVFFERDVPYYASHRDLRELPGGELILYNDYADVLPIARRHLSDADVGIVTSYCPDAIAAAELVLDSAVPTRVFYDLDSAVTLDRLARGERVEYVPERGYRDFDLVLSFCGGLALEGLERRLGARRAVPLYGSVDPTIHRPAEPDDRYRGALGYLGTWAADRDATLRTLFVEPARRMPGEHFIIGGSMYGGEFPWLENIFYVSHVPPAEHPAFYCSSRLTLNVTRRAMAALGFCPSGRFFEAASCGAPILSDYWDGLEEFFCPGSEILVARTTEEATDALARSPEELGRIATAARERTLAEHTADVRALELETALASAGRPLPESVGAA